MLLDGELVALGPDGRADFHALPTALATGSVPVRFFAFGLLTLGQRDLRPLQLEERRVLLARFLARCDATVVAPVAVARNGARLLVRVRAARIRGHRLKAP